MVPVTVLPLWLSFQSKYPPPLESEAGPDQLPAKLEDVEMLGAVGTPIPPHPTRKSPNTTNNKAFLTLTSKKTGFEPN
jgi:hypothetical protein